MVSEQMAIRAIRHLLAERVGLEFTEARLGDLRAALDEAMQTFAIPSLAVLFERLEAADLEHAAWPLLRQRLTIGETYFCRDAGQLGVIREHILKPLAEQGRPRRLRLWSAGCSTGEEAFTLAIMAQELFPEGLGWQVEVLGTDLDHAALDRAQAGTYGAWSFRGVEPGFRDQWFRRARAGWTVLPDLQRKVRFAMHNLAADPFEPLAEGESFDLILCRNVLIYFQDSNRREIIGRFLKALKPSGALVIGHNEIEPEAARALHVEHLKDSLVLRPGPQMQDPAVLEPVAAIPAPGGAAAVRPVPKPPVRPAMVNPLEDARRALAGGDHGRALALARPVRGPEALQIVGQALANLGHGLEALALVEEGLDRHPMDARLHYLHSLLASELGRDGEGLRALDRTLYLAPDHVAALMDRARACGAQGRFREGVRDLTQALASLADKAADNPVDGLEPHRTGTVRQHCAELLEQFRRRMEG